MPTSRTSVHFDQVQCGLLLYANNCGLYLSLCGPQETHTTMNRRIQENITFALLFRMDFWYLYDQPASVLPSQYAPFFRMPLSKILDSGIVDQKNWFSLIHKAHEWQGSASSTIFSENSTQRQRTGLPPIRPLCPPLLSFADDQLWITLYAITLHIIMQYYQSSSHQVE